MHDNVELLPEDFEAIRDDIAEKHPEFPFVVLPLNLLDCSCYAYSRCAEMLAKDEVREWCEQHIDVEWRIIETEHTTMQADGSAGYHREISASYSLDVEVAVINKPADYFLFDVRWRRTGRIEARAA